MEDIELHVPEFEYYKRERIWYLFVLFFALLFIFFALLAGNPTFIAIIMLGGVLLIMKSRAKPRLVAFAINDKGIYLKNKFWEYKDLKDFSIHQVGIEYYFIFTPKAQLQNSIKVPIQNPDVIRRKLNNLLPEVEYQESLIDLLVRITGL